MYQPYYNSREILKLLGKIYLEGCEIDTLTIPIHLNDDDELVN